MIAIPFTEVTSTSVMVANNAVDEPTWSSVTTYPLSGVVSKNMRKYVSLQASNTNHDPEELNSLWWTEDGPSNRWAMFDNSVQTATTRSGGLEFTLATGRITGLGLMGVLGATSVTITVRDGLGGTIIYTNTKSLASSDGTYYSFCFEAFNQISDVTWTGLLSSVNAHVTISLVGAGTVSCGLCVFGKQFEIGKAIYGFNLSIENRGRDYLDRLGNPVIIERGYSRGCSGTIEADTNTFNRLISFFSNNVSTPCLWIAAPGINDLVSASVFGKFSRSVVAIQTPSKITSSLEIAGNR